jgi:hypothetical protein
MALRQPYDVTVQISACRESIMAGLIKGICDKKPALRGFFYLGCGSRIYSFTNNRKRYLDL